MEEKGEFEQRPEAKPAEQVPLPKAKANPTTKILCVVFALVALGLGGYLFYDKVFSPSGGAAKCKTASETAASGDVDTEVRAIIGDVSKVMSDFFEGHDYNVYNSFDDGVVYEFEKGYATFIEKSYSAWYIQRVITANDSYWQKTSDSAFKNSISLAMKAHGLEETKPSDGLFLGENVLYYTSSDGYVCEFQGGMPGYFTCSHTSWLTEDKKAFVKTLIDVYKASDEWAKEYDGAIFLQANEKDIEAGGTSPYQVLYGSVLDAGIAFYRKDSESEWIYAMTAQQGPSCEFYDKNEDLKKAFKGSYCYKSDTGKDSVVE